MSEKSTEIAIAEPTEVVAMSGVFTDSDSFAFAQRAAKMLASSQLVPQAFRGNIADCVLALEMAQRIGASPLAVLQNMYIVHGKPAWSSQFLISCINASGKFTPLRYCVEGKGEDYGCYAWANDRTGERLEGPRVTIGMAKAEGWSTKNGSKWQTMPELMLRYRAATFFARLYAPELTMGIMTDSEVIDVTPIVTEPVMKSPLPQDVQSVVDQFKPADTPPATESTPAPEVTEAKEPPMPHPSVMAETIGVPLAVLKEYAIFHGMTRGSFTGVSREDREKLLADPAKTKAEISAWMDAQNQG